MYFRSIFFLFSISLLFCANAVAVETKVERMARLYGFSSSEDITAPCELDDKHTMRKYIDSLVAEKLNENPDLFEDETIINRTKIPGDIILLDKQGVYVNDRPTGIYYLPEVIGDFENSFIPCAHSACRGMIRSICSVKSLSGDEFLVYWALDGSLSYVLKKDFVLLDKI